MPRRRSDHACPQCGTMMLERKGPEEDGLNVDYYCDNEACPSYTGDSSQWDDL